MDRADLTIPPEFTTAGREDWLAAVEKALKGTPFERLVSHTPEGIVVEPLYERVAEATAQAARPAGTPWAVLQRIDHPDPAQANAQILADLDGGATGVDLVFASSCHARGHGLAAEDVDALGAVLDGVELDTIGIRLDGGYETSATLALLLALAERRGIDPGRLDVTLAGDFIGKLAGSGVLRADPSALAPRLVDLARFWQQRGLTGPMVCGDGRHWHNGGAGDAQELAYVTASAVAYLRMLEDTLSDTALAGAIGFTLVADADQVATIAKARAARRLWARILDACGLPKLPVRLHMETSWRMTTRYDPWVNMLRATVAAFAAGVGGADSVTVLPFTTALGLPDGFARRIARNTQTILIEETNLYRVSDPGTGSGAIEARTAGLVDTAWAMLQEVEADGGIISALIAGTPQRRIAATRAVREREIATRHQRITGTSAFPDVHERPVAVLAVRTNDISAAGKRVDLPPPGDGGQMQAILAAVAKGATLSDILASRPQGEPLTIEGLPPQRLAVPFEKLRSAADASAERTGRRPALFLATLGPLAQFTTRATWAKNLAAAGGLDAVGGEVYADTAALLDAWRQSNTPLVCLCSSDALYETMAEEVARSFTEAGAAAVYLAGRPTAREAALRAAGVTAFLYEGCDVLAELRAMHDRLGLSGKA